ncbi:MAG: hypothetical protein IK004_05540 [Bacteroidales bacterium]|nr:hypothetical protein [Bacteroidales bacterium]
METKETTYAQKAIQKRIKEKERLFQHRFQDHNDYSEYDDSNFEYDASYGTIVEEDYHI